MKLQGLSELYAESARFVASLKPHSESATIVALSGDLGAGKTSFVQGIARALGVQERVTSPTFVIEKIYQLAGQEFEQLVHIDAYRLESAHELEVLDWNIVKKCRTNLVLVEWPEKVPTSIPADAIRISFTGTGESRTIQYD
jgi:tRNA threonylcarbamoyladenosine biosynthesis protein TsaE